MWAFLHDAEMAAGGARRASPGDREVHLRMHSDRLMTKHQDLLFLLAVLEGTRIFPTGI